uniref:ATP synthase complex subunit 8 n=1 Tax=Streptocephalus sirindhornae TaxID=91588 RepID=A0A0U1Z9V8_9CRUS|nr:ATP synthase F0 subunit 8 [Streptocephalus sirindhornae]AJP09637.1 ATP synthase F0 subunit 8 [Streptocephalus sirindhornae]
MPQMAPLPWLTIMAATFFIILFIMALTYFNFKPSTSVVSIKSGESNSMNWKW